MSQQESVDTLTAKVGEIGTELETDVATIQAELNKIAGEHPAVNLDALTAAVGALDPKAKALGELKPA